MVCFVLPQERVKSKKQQTGAMAAMNGTYRIGNDYYAIGHIVRVYLCSPGLDETAQISFSNGHTLNISYRQGQEILERMNGKNTLIGTEVPC